MVQCLIEQFLFLRFTVGNDFDGWGRFLRHRRASRPIRTFALLLRLVFVCPLLDGGLGYPSFLADLREGYPKYDVGDYRRLDLRSSH